MFSSSIYQLTLDFSSISSLLFVVFRAAKDPHVTPYHQLQVAGRLGTPPTAFDPRLRAYEYKMARMPALKCSARISIACVALMLFSVEYLRTQYLVFWPSTSQSLSMARYPIQTAVTARGESVPAVEAAPAALTQVISSTRFSPSGQIYLQTADLIDL